MEIYKLKTEELSDFEFKNGINKMRVPELFFGDYVTTLRDVLNKRFPFMRVLVAYTESMYEKFATGVATAFEKTNSAYTEYVVTEGENGAFNFGSEYRCVVAVGEEAYYSLVPFACERNVPVITIMTEGDLFGLVPSETLVEENGIYSFKTFNAQKTLILDKTLYKSFDNKTVASVISHGLSYLSGLFDLTTKVRRQPLKECTDLLKYAVNGFLNLDFSDETFYDKYVEYSLKLGMAEYFSGKNHVTRLSPFWCGVAFGKKPFSLYGYYAMKKLCDLYYIYFTEDLTDYPVVCDYEKNVSEIAKRKGINASCLMKMNRPDAKEYYSFETELTKNKKFFAEKLVKIRPLVLKGERVISSVYPCADVTDEEISEAIRTAPYITDEKILLKYIRDSGLLENV